MGIRFRAARTFAVVKRFVAKPPWNDQGANLDADRNRAQSDAERLNTHRHSGRFGGTGI